MVYTFTAVSFVFAAIFGTFAYVGPWLVWEALQSGLDDAVIMKSEKSDGYGAWADSTHEDAVAQYLGIYFWNVKNPSKVYWEGAKPDLEKVGPFVFRQHWKMLDVGFGCEQPTPDATRAPTTTTTTAAPGTRPATSSGAATTTGASTTLPPTTTGASTTPPPTTAGASTTPPPTTTGAPSTEAPTTQPPSWSRDCEEWVWYKKYQTYEFDAEKTAPLDLNMTIVLPNLLFQGAVARWEQETGGPNACHDMAEHGMIAFGTTPLGSCPDWKHFSHEQLLFMNRTANELLFGFPGPNDLTRDRLSFPGVLKQRTHVNASVAAKAIKYKVHRTGSKNKKEIAWVEMLNGKHTVEWADPAFNKVGGFEGTLFPRNVDSKEEFHVWVDELFRPVWFSHENRRKKKVHGIELLEFHLEESQLRREPHYYSEWPAINNVTNKQDIGCETFMSLPALAKAPEELAGRFTGVSPDLDKDISFLYIEPISGLLMKAEKRLQLNIRVQADPITWPTSVLQPHCILAPDAPVTWFPNTTSFDVFPILVAEEFGEIGEKQAKKFKDSVHGALMIWMVVFVTMISLSVVCMVSTFICCYRERKKTEQDSLDSYGSPNGDSTVQYRTFS